MSCSHNTRSEFVPFVVSRRKIIIPMRSQQYYNIIITARAITTPSENVADRPDTRPQKRNVISRNGDENIQNLSRPAQWENAKRS